MAHASCRACPLHGAAGRLLDHGQLLVELAGGGAARANGSRLLALIGQELGGALTIKPQLASLPFPAASDSVYHSASASHASSPPGLTDIPPPSLASSTAQPAHPSLAVEPQLAVDCLASFLSNASALRFLMPPVLTQQLAGLLEAAMQQGGLLVPDTMNRGWQVSRHFSDSKLAGGSAPNFRDTLSLRILD